LRVFHGSRGAPLALLRWEVRSERALTLVPRDEAAQLRKVLWWGRGAPGLGKGLGFGDVPPLDRTRPSC